MAVKTFSAKPVQVQAIQLLARTDPDVDNAQEIADWCKGLAVWNYDSQTGGREVRVTFINPTDIVYTALTYRVEETDWVIRKLDGDFYMMSDTDFQEHYDTENFNAPETCRHCLADPRYTPMGDPDEKLCPVCGVNYSGPRRSKEYQILVASGLVAKGK